MNMNKKITLMLIIIFLSLNLSGDTYKNYSQVIDLVKINKDIDKFYTYVPYYNRGLCWNDLNKYQKAIDDYTLALSAKSNYPECYYARGLAYFQIGNIEAAKSDFKRYMSSKPSESHIDS